MAEIQLDDYVIIQFGKDAQKFVKIKEDSVIQLSRLGKLKASAIVGQQYGRVFEIINESSLRPLEIDEINADFAPAMLNANDNESRIMNRQSNSSSSSQGDAQLSVDSVSSFTVGANNQKINDCNSVQTLSQDQIEELAKSSSNVNDLISQLTGAHQQFDLKTEYSKAKYIKRKKLKFHKVIRLVQPNSFNLCQWAFVKHPDQVHHIRPDTLASMIQTLNIQQGGCYLVDEDSAGVLTLAIAERLGGLGKIISLHSKDASYVYPYTFYAKLQNRECIHHLPWSMFNASADDDTLPQSVRNALSALRSTKFDGLVTASRYQAQGVIKQLMPFLKLNSIIVAQSLAKESLASTFEFMRGSSQFVDVQLRSQWYREYQVYPDRMHPQNNTYASGGFILSGIKVELVEDCPSSTMDNYLQIESQQPSESVVAGDKRPRDEDDPTTLE
ncbi:hypothetical protein MIR68_004739 [Amoeboaphelidium protococcarum]|nr:hypothetical protein MIR68_004739 [Amoeboaphelidium protococcarum]